MAWIEVHQSLSLHPKLLALADDLGEDRLMTMGRLLLLWWWALDVTRDGALRGVTAQNLARVMGWSNDPETLRNALLLNRWLDQDEQGNLAIHHWQDYAGRLIDKREQNRQRQKTYRDRRNALSNGDVPVTSASRNDATVPNRTSIIPKGGQAPQKDTTNGNGHDKMVSLADYKRMMESAGNKVSFLGQVFKELHPSASSDDKDKCFARLGEMAKNDAKGDYGLVLSVIYRTQDGLALISGEHLNYIHGTLKTQLLSKKDAPSQKQGRIQDYPALN